MAVSGKAFSISNRISEAEICSVQMAWQMAELQTAEWQMPQW